MAATASAQRAQRRCPARRRNPRGEGGRLREEILDAAMELAAASGNLAELSLRAVAKKADITAPSIYRHFPDLDHLAAAVVERCFAELAASRASPPPGVGPVELLRYRLHGYARFALDKPGRYQVMFGPDPLPAPAASYRDSPGWPTFESLVVAVARCYQAGQAHVGTDPVRTATLLWATMHGLVSLRINRPGFPWPDIYELVDDAIARLLGTGPPGTEKG